MLRYGNICLFDNVGHSLYQTLNKVYDAKDAKNIYTVALLRTAFPNIKDYQIKDKYEKSWASILYPNAAVSKNSISSLLINLGKSYDLIHKFMEERINEMVSESTKILIDGMLKNDNSKIDSFAGFSYKGRIKGTKDISIICALDVEKREPICIKLFKGNSPDFSNIYEFFDEFKLPNGLAIDDKAFPFEKLKNKEFKDKKIGFIHPIKRSSKKPIELSMYDKMSVIKTVDKNLLASKDKDDETGYYYYLFKDLDKASLEEKDYLKKKDFDINKYNNLKVKFGTICFVSNADLDLIDVFNYYKLRWEIEIVFKMYKDILSLNTTRENDNYSTIGSEFINFLSTIMTCRVKNKIEEKGLFKKHTYNDIIDRMTDIIKYTTDTTKANWKLCNISKEDSELAMALGV